MPLCHILSGSCTTEVVNVFHEGTLSPNDEPTAKLPDDLTGSIIGDQVQTMTPVDKSVENLNVESILGVKKPALTALQRRKKKVKESRSTISSYLIDDDIED